MGKMATIPRNRISGLTYCRRVRLCGPEAFPLHDHEFGEIFWVDEGRCRHFVNNRMISLTQGALVLIRPWDCHSFHGPEGRPFYLNNTCFDWRIFQYLQQRYFPGSGLVYGETGEEPKMLQMNGRQMQKARQLFLDLFHGGGDRLAIERFLLNFFAEFFPLSDRQGMMASDLPDWMRPAWEQIQQPECFRLGVREFCRLGGRSREHVCREFRKATGQTPGQMVHQLRMKHAALLLEVSSQQIVDISLECGFESLSHFYACFRKAHGLSPLAYRQRAQGRMY